MVGSCGTAQHGEFNSLQENSVSNECGSTGIYVHIPFCKRKCSYCHFAVTADRVAERSSYLKALKSEWERRKGQIAGLSVRSLYLGGGTPSRLSAANITDLISWFPKAGEITLEANPEDITLEYVRLVASAGVNRISLGAQTLDDALLKALGRSHSAVQTLRAIDSVIAGGVHNLSVDLMIELPDQSVDRVICDVEELVKTPITHLSLYNLTLEPPSTFYRQRERLKHRLPSETQCLAQLNEAVDRLTRSGFHRYEISAFARGPFESLHNTGYWQGLPFLGLGPSAFSYLNGMRTRNVLSLAEYVRKHEAQVETIDFCEELPPEEQVRELLAIGLRRIAGIHLPSFERQFGQLSPEVKADTIRLVSEGLLALENEQLHLTDRGLLFHDHVASELI